jgi:(1->4)-alpha-D-glucan 1-alpha-D-glucosylmutase
LASFRERITAYMQKATREAKLYTSWLNPNEVYDTAMSDFVAAVLDPANPCLTEIATFARRISFFGQINSLAQTTLKLTAPGVPDIYQGTELWDFSLVDPDNRRPVDYALRQRYLAELDAHGEASAALAEELLAQHDDGRIKLYLISRLLRYRRQQPLLFAEGSYRALESSGERAEHVVAFVRSLKSQQLVVAVPRLPTRLTAGEARMPLGKASWGETRLLLPEDSATARWRNLLTGESSEGLRLAEVFARLPVAVLVREVDVGACGT